MKTPPAPSLVPARFTSRLLPAPEERRFQGIPGIECGPGGLLWAVWYAGGAEQNGEGAGNFLVAASSADGGASWAERFLVLPPGPEDRVFDPCLWLDPLGRLWLFWAQSASPTNGTFDGWAGVWASLAADADDPATTWSPPRRLCDGIMMNKPVVGADGAWLLPVSIWRREETAPALAERAGAGVVASADAGATWEWRGQAVPEPPGIDEHMLLPRRDGSLWMLIRTEGGLLEALSHDGGRSWSAPRLSPIPNVNSRFFLRRLASGRVVLVTHNPPPPVPKTPNEARSYLTAWLSEDDGARWAGGLVLDERPAISYPDGVEAGGRLLLVYDRCRNTAGEILLASVDEAEILAGKPSGQTRLARVLSRMGEG